MKNQNNTIIVYTYRYIWKTKEGNLCVKFITDVQEAHAKFQEAIKNDTNIISCMREYVNEVNFAYIGFTEAVKEEKKETEEKNNEEISKVGK